MSFVLHRDERGFLECRIGENVIAVHEPLPALEALSETLDRVESDGLGECCWEQPTGIYRWVFRKTAGEDGVVKANVALIWSAGVVTGWEHVWWGEVEWVEFLREAKAQIAVATANL
jgi:hypothetical protein